MTYRQRPLRAPILATAATLSLGAQGVLAQDTALSASENARQPNVLFMISDDLNARIAPYGGQAITPHLDRLASQGVTFDRAYSQYPWCAPSRASFMTGTRPNTNGIMDLTTPVRNNLPDIITLPEYFRDAGYYTARVGKVFHQGVPFGVGRDGLDDAQSWDERFNPSGCDMDSFDRLTNLTPGIPLGAALTYLRDDCEDEYQTDGMVATQTIELLEQATGDDRPFFIAAGFYRPHVPEIVPEAYFDLYPPEQIAIAQNTPEHLSAVLPASRTWTPDHLGMTPGEQRRFIHAYYAATTFIDAQVGRLLDAVEELDLADDTIVVFTSDHGFLLGEHGQWQKQLLFEDSVRVPLIIRVPGTQNAGQRSPRTVELVDLYPTLTDLAGLPQYSRNEGTSMVRLLEDPEDATWIKPALSQVLGGRSVRTERYRYTEWEEGRSGRELYDHTNDPMERVNLVDDPSYAEVIELLRAMLPPEPVESLPNRSAYDPDENCITPSERYMTRPGGGAGGSAPAGGGSGGPPPGLVICDG
ncbi:sulfatase [Natronohydrobacter thiooxidans]|uniref:sulfatase n=1 Tax=Natronohydrobacter thiooxidans TaxID=87172 RepID=UPI0008FF754B|nr:sulfatase [Natronohydrobacter thiooxidans]